MDSLLLMVHDMGARPEGTLSKAGLAALGVLSVVGFLPALASSSAVIGVQSSAGAEARTEVAAPPARLSSPLPEHHVANVAVDVLEPEPSAPPPPPPPEPVEAPPAPDTVPEVAEAAPEEPAPPVAASQPSVELVAVAPADPPTAGLAGLGGGLTTTTAPATGALPLPLPAPIVDEVVTPLLGSLLGL